MRTDSETYGKWYGETLSSENKKQFYIPQGFAHGFLVLSQTAEFVYKCTEFYHPEDECGIIWNDADININWPLDKIHEVNLANKDRSWLNFKEYKKMIK